MSSPPANSEPGPPFRSLPDRWTMEWSRRPDARALRISGESEGWVRFAELDARTRSAAGALADRGVTRGDRVCWHAASTVEAVVAALAVLRLGAVLVPLNPAQSELERRTIVEDIAPRLVIAPTEATSFSDLPHHRADGSDGLAVPLAEDLSGEDMALVIYTSGTTGNPKGAQLTHRNLAAGIDALISAWELNEGDHLVCALPLFHIHGLVASLFGILSAGGALELHPRFDASSFLEATASPRASLAFCVPTMLHRLAAADPSMLSGLRLLVSGSAPLSVSLFEEFKNRASQTILERYGMTETLLTMSNPLHGERRAGTVGFPLPGVIIDAPTHRDEARELRISGPTVFAGYWNRPAATSEVLQDGWMATGDLVTMDADGYLVICGRSKELIISGGFNVYPSEVEDALRGRLGIVDAAVVGRPSAEWGEEVVAFVVLEEAGHLDEAALREQLSSELSKYKVPRKFEVTTELPRNALGKIQRHLL